MRNIRYATGLLLAALLLAVPLRAESGLLITSFNGSGNIAWSHSEDTGFHRVEWASSLTGSWHSTWAQLTGIPANGGVSQASVPMFYRVVWYEGESSSATVTTNMIHYVDATEEMFITNELQCLTSGTDTYYGTFLHAPVVAGSVFIIVGADLFFDTGAGTLTGGQGGGINYGTGAWNVRCLGVPNPGSRISVTYLYLGTAPVLVPEITVVGENLGVSVSGVANYAGLLNHVTVQPSSLTINMGGLVFYDTGTGLLVATGGSSGTINYETGLWRLSISGIITPDLLITASYLAVEYPPDEETTLNTEVTVTGEFQALPGLWGDFVTDTRQPLIADGLRVSRWSKCAVQEWV